jgi:hypothetical protein
MTRNVFDQTDEEAGPKRPHLSHDQLETIVTDAGKLGSFKEALLQHAVEYGIEDIDFLFPDARSVTSEPDVIGRRVEWVQSVLGGAKHSPFSRVKTVVADITEDEARARGYIKGNQKAEEFFKLIKRETTPQTIYKKQKLDRDDVLDIVDLDVVAWMRAEMKVMLDEELAGAILIGDGRSAGDDDKIREDKIRPIASDDELYVTTVNVNLDDSNSNADELVDAVIANRKYYKGTGSPTFFTTEDIISAFLTVKDNFGRRIYTTLADVQAVLRVSEHRSGRDLRPRSGRRGHHGQPHGLHPWCRPWRSAATMFDDFDLDFNQLKYLLETRVLWLLDQAEVGCRHQACCGYERCPGRADVQCDHACYHDPDDHWCGLQDQWCNGYRYGHHHGDH